MDRKDIDDALYGAMMEALSNSGLPITARAKARIADELTAEGVRLVLTQMKVEGAPATKAKTAKPRGRPRKAPAAQPDLPGIPMTPPDATTPAPFGSR
jgi:hypothetical protein